MENKNQGFSKNTYKTTGLKRKRNQRKIKSRCPEAGVGLR